MSRQIMEQVVDCDHGVKVKITTYADGAVVIIGARRTHVINEMGYDVQKLAPGSSMAILVECGPGSIEAEMVRSGAPWFDGLNYPKMSAHCFMFTTPLGEIRVQASCPANSIPIAQAEMATA